MFNVGIYDASGNTLSLNSFDDSGTVKASFDSSGTYYVGLSSYYSSSADNDDYTITATYDSSSFTRETESNNGLATADTLTSGVAMTGQLSGGYSTEVDTINFLLAAQAQ